jgi:hypothetical protein
MKARVAVFRGYVTILLLRRRERAAGSLDEGHLI